MPQITIRNAHINYEILGNSGPWVALSPGGRRPLEGVKHLAERVAAKGYRVLIFDRRNCGASDVVFEGTPDAPTEYEIWAEDLYAMLKHFNATPAWVGGGSSGCRMSMLLAMKHPDAVKGLPFVPGESRLAAEVADQQVVSVEAGYNIYQANCSRCHGANGQGGIGPVLNDQSKLFAHLNENYLRNVLVVGGRYVCGNANSLMPVWADTGSPPGPLNYMEINDLIAFLRATNDQTYLARDPALLEPIVDRSTGQEKTFTGWRDPNYVPAPGATPVPACWSDAFAAPSASASASASASPSESGGEIGRAHV
mgnify:CR=1 FL=1